MTATVVRLPEKPFPTTWSTASKVQKCSHDWESVYAEMNPGHFVEVDRCTHCHGPRCPRRPDYRECTLLRDHTSVHMFQDGTYEPLGGAS